jgi:hypothetical protein
MDKLILKIEYDAFPLTNGVEDFDKIDVFKSELSSDYEVFIKPRPVGRGGGAYQFIVDLLIDLTLEDYLKIVGGYLGGKILDKIIDPKIEKYLFRPFKSAYEKLKQLNPILDCYRLRIEFVDTQINVYGIYENSIIEINEMILGALKQHYDNLKTGLGRLPDEIHIPLLIDAKEDEHIYRTPLGFDEYLTGLDKMNYLKLWGTMDFNGIKTIYDLENKVVIPGEFMTESEFYKHLRLK